MNINQSFWITRLKQRKLCGGKIVHKICIVTVKDLNKVMKNGVYGRKLFAFHNKYFMELDGLYGGEAGG